MNRNDFLFWYFANYFTYSTFDRITDQRVKSIGTAFVQNADKGTIWMRG